MESLTCRQDHVGRLLQRGHSAMQADSVSEEDRRQIEAQMLLLNAQWEELRIAAMDRQTRLRRGNHMLLIGQLAYMTVAAQMNAFKLYFFIYVNNKNH